MKSVAQSLQQVTAELDGGGGQAAFLGDVKDESLVTEFLAEDAVFLLQVSDHVLLVPVDEAGEGHEEEVPGLMEHGCDNTSAGQRPDLMKARHP